MTLLAATADAFFSSYSGDDAQPFCSVLPPATMAVHPVSPGGLRLEGKADDEDEDVIEDT